MKSRILTDALREVRRTLGRYLSLFLLSALAVAFLAGLRATAPDMERSADVYFDARGLMDIQVLSTLGLTDDDIDALVSQEGVAYAEGAYTVDAIAHGQPSDQIVKVLSLSSRINLPRLVSGRLATSPTECLVEPALLDTMGLALGDVLTLDTGEDAFEDALAGRVFTIVGTADSPLYIAVERGSSSLGTGKVSAFLLLPAEAFTMEAYTNAYLLAEGAQDLYCYEDPYDQTLTALLDCLEPLGDSRAGLRYDEVMAEAQQELADAEAEVEQELADARDELADGRQELDDGWADYRQGWVDYRREMADARQKIDDAEYIDLPDALQQLQDAEVEYTDGMQELADGWVEYDEGVEEYQDGILEYEKGYAEITNRLPEYNDGLQKLQDGEAEYREGVLTYNQGLGKLQEGGRQIAEAEAQLREALELLYDGETAYRSGLSEFNENRALLESGSTQFYGGVASLMALAGAEGLTADDFLDTLAAMPPEALLGYWGQLEPQVAATRAQLEAMLENPALLAEQRALIEAQLAQLPASGEAFVIQVQTLLATREGLRAGQAQLDAGQGALASAASALSWGRMEYEDGWKKLGKSKKEFLTAIEEAQEGGVELKEARQELEDGWAEFREGDAELEDGFRQLDEAKTALSDAQIELEEGLADLLEGEQEVLDGRQELDEGWAEYRQGLVDLADARITLREEDAKVLQALADAEVELTDGEAEYADGLQEYKDGRAEAEEELRDARRKIGEIEDCEWYVLGRETNMGYVSFQQNAQRMDNLADLFPLIFFLVAALVCLTTMTRMVEEQRVEIGGLKALGYSRGAISVKYVGYGLSASLFGGLCGLAVGCTLIPTIIYTAWGILFTMGDLVIFFFPGISFAAVGAAVLTVTGAAILTCLSTLSASPAQLMRPKTPKAGKRVFLERIGPLWRRLSFLQKVTLRNLFRYKRRFLMTVVGIGGCTALIVTGFGLRDSIFDIMTLQFDELYSYTSQVGLADRVTEEELANLDRALAEDTNVTAWLPTHQVSLSVESDTRTMDATLFATADPQRFGDFIHLRHRLDRAPVSLSDDGAVITEKLASLLDVGVGDTITLAGDTRVQVQITDITEHYVMHFIYLTAPGYEALYGASPEENMVLAQYQADTQEVSDEVSTRLLPLSGVTSVSRISDTRHTFQHSMETVDYAVVLIIISAGALAFVVLFNLTNINITERLRELATLKVLGFYQRELSAYVFRENALLTVFGVLMGLVMGKYLHQWLVLTVEIDMVMFGRAARPASYLYAILLTLLFSLVVNLLSGRKLKKIDMVESLKTVE